MIRFALAGTGIILLVMGIAELLYITVNRIRVRKLLMKVFVFLYGLLLVGLAFSIASMPGEYHGQGFFLTVLALITAGPFLILFPRKPRAFLQSMLKAQNRRAVSMLLIFDSLLRFAAGAVLIYFSA